MRDIFKQIKRFNDIDFSEGKAFTINLTASNSSEGSNSRVSDKDDTTTANTNKMAVGGKYKITVKPYMTEKASSRFEFMKKWNNDIPMPMCIMAGEVLQETRGMVRMSLQGKAEPSSFCSVCGRHLTNPVSMIYGIGPECSVKVGLDRILTENEAREQWNTIAQKLINVTWEGWIIKSAIKEWKEI